MYTITILFLTAILVFGSIIVGSITMYIASLWSAFNLLNKTVAVMFILGISGAIVLMGYSIYMLDYTYSQGVLKEQSLVDRPL